MSISKRWFDHAKKNANVNNIQNVEFINNRVKNVLKYLKVEPDIIIVDPPRSGLVPKALKRVIETNVRITGMTTGYRVSIPVQIVKAVTANLS